MTTLGDVMVCRGGSLNASAFPEEEFELYSIPAHDRDGPEIARGSEIGSSKQIVQPGDVMISKIIPHIRRARVVAPFAGRRQIASGEWIVFRGSNFDPDYLRHFLLSDGFHGQFMNTVAGVGGSLVRARPAQVKAIPLFLPPLTEQRRIAAILDHADALRAKRRQVLSHLDSLTQSVFTEMFSAGDFEPMPARALMPRMRNGLSPATDGTHEAQVLTLSSVTQGLFDPAAVKAGVFAIEPPTDKRITDGDFLMCRGNGNKALVGVGTYSRENRPDLVFPDTVIAGKVDTKLVALPFLEAAWKRRDVRAQIEAVARTTNGTYKVNQQTLSGVLVPVPPLDLQMAFAAKVTHVTQQHAAVQRGSAVDDELFASLQSRAFRGEL